MSALLSDHAASTALVKQRRWRMTVYDLRRDHVMPEGSCGFLYVRAGVALVSSCGQTQRLAKGQGAFAGPGALLSSHDAWLFEVARPAEPPRFVQGLEPVLSRIAVTTDESQILRADRVESEAGARTPRHRHRGPGIRRLERGLLLAELGDGLERVGAGDAWFETREEDVVGYNISGGSNAFIRVMLLPSELAGGQSSFMASSQAEAAKPRAARLSLFGEWRLDELSSC